MNPIQAPRLNSVDLMKFVMAFAVIVIHVQVLFFGKMVYPWLINWFICLAVPFFFTSSGFLVGRRLSDIQQSRERSQYLLSKAGRFAKMFGLWLLIYLPFSIKEYMDGNFPSVINFAQAYLSAVFFRGESFLAWPLWYLYSSALAYLIMGVFAKYNVRLVWAAICFFVLWIGASLYFENPSHSRIFGGGAYIAAGMLVQQYRSRCINWLVVAGGFIISALSYDLFFFPLFGGVALFAGACMLRLSNKSIYATLNALSVWIYLIHMYAIYLLFMMVMHLHVSYGKYTILLAAFALSFLAAALLNALSKKFALLTKLI